MGGNVLVPMTTLICAMTTLLIAATALILAVAARAALDPDVARLTLPAPLSWAPPSRPTPTVPGAP